MGDHVVPRHAELSICHNGRQRSVMGLRLSKPGRSVHYVVVPFNLTADEAAKARSITMTFRIVSKDPEYNDHVEPNITGPAMLHLFFERAGDDFSNSDEFYRWWCTDSSGAYVLGAQDNQVVTVSCSLNVKSWMSVFGKRDETQFQNALANIGWVGFTFGGSGGWGHGVNLTDGLARFELIDYRLE
jgi:hypothetical protein